MTTIHITFWGFVAGLLLLTVPFGVLYALRVEPLWKPLKSLLRTFAALVVVGLMAKAAFVVDNVAFSLLAIVITAAVVAWAVVAKARIRQWQYTLPVFMGLLVSALPLGLFYLFAVLGEGQPFATRWMVPLVGMAVGAMAEANSRALSAYYDGLAHHHRLYHYLVGNGASHAEAVGYFFRRALRSSLVACLGRMGVLGMGIVPASVATVLLCGAGVETAVAFAITLMVLLLAIAVCSLVATLWLARRYSFDKYEEINVKR